MLTTLEGPLAKLRLDASNVLKTLKEECWTGGGRTHIHYVYIYIYICVCVCDIYIIVIYTIIIIYK